MSSNNSSDAVAALLGGGIAIFYLIMWLFAMACCVLALIALWKMFSKAGRPGWAAIIPFYNIWILCDICFNNNILWFILAIIPATSWIAMAVSCFALAKAFGKGAGFGVLTFLFPYIGYAILGFSKSIEYTGDKM